MDWTAFRLCCEREGIRSEHCALEYDPRWHFLDEEVGLEVARAGGVLDALGQARLVVEVETTCQRRQQPRVMRLEHGGEERKGREMRAVILGRQCEAAGKTAQRPSECERDLPVSQVFRLGSGAARHRQGVVVEWRQDGGPELRSHAVFVASCRTFRQRHHPALRLADACSAGREPRVEERADDAMNPPIAVP